MSEEEKACLAWWIGVDYYLRVNCHVEAKFASYLYDMHVYCAIKTTVKTRGIQSLTDQWSSFAL